MALDVDIEFFNSIRELVNYVDRCIKETEEKLREISSIIERLKESVSKYEAIKRMIRDVIGEKESMAPVTLEIAAFKMLIDPRPIDEYEVLSKAYAVMRDRVDVLKRIREILALLERYLGDEKVSIMVELRGGVPTKMIMKSR